jgi:hypothetical protein
VRPSLTKKKEKKKRTLTALLRVDYEDRSLETRKAIRRLLQ